MQRAACAKPDPAAKSALQASAPHQCAPSGMPPSTDAISTVYRAAMCHVRATVTQTLRDHRTFQSCRKNRRCPMHVPIILQSAVHFCFLMRAWRRAQFCKKSHFWRVRGKKKSSESAHYVFSHVFDHAEFGGVVFFQKIPLYEKVKKINLPINTSEKQNRNFTKSLNLDTP
jgi:ribosomal protein L39E